MRYFYDLLYPHLYHWGIHNVKTPPKLYIVNGLSEDNCITVREYYSTSPVRKNSISSAIQIVVATSFMNWHLNLEGL